jgi:hypothetical protein
MSAAAVTVAQRVLDATAGDPLGVQLDTAVLMAEEERAQTLLDLAESCNTSSFFTSTLGDVRVCVAKQNCFLALTSLTCSTTGRVARRTASAARAARAVSTGAE